MPPGPIGVTAIKFGIDNRRLKHGVQLATGTAMMDMLYCLGTIFATSAVYGAISGFSEDHPIVMLLFQVSVALLFIVLGVVSIRPRKTHSDGRSRKPGIFSKYIDTLTQ